MSLFLRGQFISDFFYFLHLLLLWWWCFISPLLVAGICFCVGVPRLLIFQFLLNFAVSCAQVAKLNQTQRKVANEPLWWVLAAEEVRIKTLKFQASTSVSMTLFFKRRSLWVHSKLFFIIIFLLYSFLSLLDSWNLGMFFLNRNMETLHVLFTFLFSICVCKNSCF